MRKHTKKSKYAAVLLLSALLLCSCGQAEEEEQMIILEEEEESVAGVVGVTYQDVVSTMKILLEYKSLVSEELSFKVERRTIEEVLVERGDTVTKGQLLISLGTQDLQDEIDAKTYEIRRMELQLDALEKSKAQDILEENFEYAVRDPGNTSYTEEVHEDHLERIEDSYRNNIQNYQDSLYIARKRLEELKQGGNDEQIYAPFDGVVTYLRADLEGSQTKIDSTVVTVMDPTECYFFADKPEMGQYLSEGQILTLTINGGLSAGDYQVVPVFDEDAGTLKFNFADGGEDLSIAVGTRGSITVELGKRMHVLAVPEKAVHQAGDITYVYVIDENGYRIVRPIETGLYGDSYVEVVSGLEEGERVAASAK